MQLDNLNLFNFFVSLLPIVLLLIFMVKFQMPSFKAAPLVLVVTFITGTLFFKAGAFLLANEVLKAVWSAFTIILVVFTALLVYEVTDEAKSFSSLNAKMKKIAPNELVRIIGLAMVFSSFLQGATGFGVPIVVTSPLLLAMNVHPLFAVVLPLCGHTWGGTFGTLAVAWLSLVSESNIEPDLILKTGIYAGVFLWILNFLGGMAICWFYGKWKGLKKGFVAVCIFSLIQGGGELYLTQTNAILAAFLPSCVALVAFAFVSKLPIYNHEWCIENSPIMNRFNKNEIRTQTNHMNLLETFFPYILMTLFTLSLLLQPNIKQALSSFKIGFDFPETTTALGFVNPSVSNYGTLAPLSHSSTYLFLSSLGGYFYYKNKRYIQNVSLSILVRRAFKRTLKPSAAILSLIMMSKVMAGSGQIYILAQTAAASLGANYVLVAPFVGTLGCFITSSSMSSNILFANFQNTMSNLLSLNTAAVLGSQTAGASIGNSIAPSNVTLGTTTANIVGQEGKVLKILLPLVLCVAALFGVLLYII